jgi:tripartite-type tricarboxylate transporter receptor subunit TctC
MFASKSAPGYACRQIPENRWEETMTRIGTLFAAVMSCVALGGAAQAQLNPSRNVTLVVPIGAGGGVDTMARILAAKLQERMKINFVVENRTGAGGSIGTDSVAKAAPDGHTLLFMEMGAAIRKWLHKNNPFDVIKDFEPVAQVSMIQILLFAHPSFPANDLKGTIAYVKANPDKASAGIPGVGSPHHMASAMLDVAAKIKLTTVTYRGAAAATNDLIAGQIPLAWAAPTAVVPHVQAGKVKGIGVASPKRFPGLPNVQTFAENAGLDINADTWFGVVAPANTPKAIVAQLEQEIKAITEMPDVRQRAEAAGLTISYGDSAQFRKLIASDHERFGKLIQAAGITPN